MNKLIILFFISTALGCSHNSDCNYPQGICSNGVCRCDFEWYGDVCNLSWYSIEGWKDFFWGMCYLGAAMQAFVFIRSVYQLWGQTTVSPNGIRKLPKNFVAMTLFTLILASFVRFLWCVLDPKGVRDLIPDPLEIFLYIFPILLWGCVDFLLLLSWIALQKAAGIKRLDTTKLRNGVIVAAVVSAIITAPLAIYQSVSYNSVLSVLLLNGFMAIIVLGLACGSIFFGLRLNKSLKEMLDFQQSDHLRNILYKSSLYLIWGNVIQLAIVASLITYSGLGGARDPWTFVIFQYLFRAEEFIYSLIVLIITNPNKAEDTMQKPLLNK